MRFALIGLAVLIVAGGVYWYLTRMGGGVDVPSGSQYSICDAQHTQVPTFEDVTDLKIEDLRVGTGREGTAGTKVSVHYIGKLTSGQKFDSSCDRSAAFKFNLGTGQVIPGWDKGVQGMKEGGIRRLTIPSSMGYGPTGAGGVIPPNATLGFDVELIKVE